MLTRRRFWRACMTGIETGLSFAIFVVSMLTIAIGFTTGSTLHLARLGAIALGIVLGSILAELATALKDSQKPKP